MSSIGLWGSGASPLGVKTPRWKRMGMSLTLGLGQTRGVGAVRIWGSRSGEDGGAELMGRGAPDLRPPVLWGELGGALMTDWGSLENKALDGLGEPGGTAGVLHCVDCRPRLRGELAGTGETMRLPRSECGDVDARVSGRRERRDRRLGLIGGVTEHAGECGREPQPAIPNMESSGLDQLGDI